MVTQILDVSVLNDELLCRVSTGGDIEATKAFDDALSKIEIAANIIKNGGLVAFPTETVYGLGADAFNAEAAGKIYKAKGRPSDNPMIVHIANIIDMDKIVSSKPRNAIKLADKFWPGPLTIILNKRAEVPDVTTGGLSTVAMRMPDNFIAQELIRKAGTPIAAPSANISGRPSPTRAKHVIADLNGRVDAILVGADSRIGLESTVVDLTEDIPIILRPGIVSEKELSFISGCQVRVDGRLLSSDASEDEKPPKSPGTKYKHYAPLAEMIVIQGEQAKVRAEIERMKKEKEGAGLKVGVMLFENSMQDVAAHDFYAMLRDFDDVGTDLIIAGAVDAENAVGFALMNRMIKSAGNNVIRV